MAFDVTINYKSKRETMGRCINNRNRVIGTRIDVHWPISLMLRVEPWHWALTPSLELSCDYSTGDAQNSKKVKHDSLASYSTHACVLWHTGKFTVALRTFGELQFCREYILHLSAMQYFQFLSGPRRIEEFTKYLLASGLRMRFNWWKVLWVSSLSKSYWVPPFPSLRCTGCNKR